MNPPDDGPPQASSPLARLRAELPGASLRAFAGDRLGQAVLIAAAVYGGFIAVTPWFESTRVFLLERAHQRIPFALYAVLQPAPAMYSYQNLVFKSVTEDEDGPVRSPEDEKPGWNIHHPLRAVYEPKAKRMKRREAARNIRFRFESTYRGTTVRTTYDLTGDKVTLVEETK